jgi:hypothetical protein
MSIMRFINILVVLLAGIALVTTLLLTSTASASTANTTQGPLDDLFLLKNTQTSRISSFNSSGANRDFTTVKPGETLTIAAIEGAGIIRRFYLAPFGADRMRYRKLVLRMYWDGAEKPCIEVPLGDFFGSGLGILRYFEAGPIRVNSGVDGIDFDGMVSYLPMPFKQGARITIENDGGVENLRLWFQVDYEAMAPEQLPANAGRLHASWHREALTQIDEGTVRNSSMGSDDISNTSGDGNFTLLETSGQGTFVGFFLTVDNIAGGWWGEGDDMIFVDGARWPPTYAGTGTEEIFNAGCCPDVEFTRSDSGFYVIENRGNRWGGKNQLYRFYLNDPVHFQKSIRASIEHGHANGFENDYSATAFWYQKDDHSSFPAMPPANDRLPAWSQPVRAALQLEAGIRDAALAVVTDESANAASAEFKLELAATMIGATHAFQALDDDAYVEAVDTMKKLLDTLHQNTGQDQTPSN